MSSVRRTLIVRMTLLLTIVSLATASTSYVLAKGEANKFLDAQLAEVAMNAGPGLKEEVRRRHDHELEDRLVVQIWERSGTLIYASGPDNSIPRQPDDGYFDVMADNEAWRTYIASDDQLVVQISQRWSARDEIATRAAIGATLPFVLAIPFAWLLIGWSVNQVLEGLGRLSAELEKRSIEARDVLSPDGVPTEIAPLIGAMNSLIIRQRQAVETQLRFVEDAAHQLRTPLAALQLQVDNLFEHNLARPFPDLVADLREGIGRGTRLVGQLLRMARAESPSTGEQQAMSVSDVVRVVVGDCFPILEANGLTMAVNLDEDMKIKGNRADLELLLRILIENSICYTSSGGSVTITAKWTAQDAVIEIIDSGCGIPESALPFVFDRFFRAAPPDVEGAGLGLAIAKAIADRNRYGLSLRNRRDAVGLIAVIEFS